MSDLYLSRIAAAVERWVESSPLAAAAVLDLINSVGGLAALEGKIVDNQADFSDLLITGELRVTRVITALSASLQGLQVGPINLPLALNGRRVFTLLGSSLIVAGKYADFSVATWGGGLLAVSADSQSTYPHLYTLGISSTTGLAYTAPIVESGLWGLSDGGAVETIRVSNITASNRRANVYALSFGFGGGGGFYE